MKIAQPISVIRRLIAAAASLFLLCTTGGAQTSDIPGAAALGSLVREQFDTNADGSIDTGEWQTGVASGFDSLDGNGDGSVTSAEVDLLAEPLREQFGDFGGALVAALVKAVVQNLDSDRDKTISRDEYTEETGKILKRLDVDGDGSVSEQELRSLPAKVLATQQGQGSK